MNCMTRTSTNDAFKVFCLVKEEQFRATRIGSLFYMSMLYRKCCRLLGCKPNRVCQFEFIPKVAKELTWNRFVLYAGISMASDQRHLDDSAGDQPILPLCNRKKPETKVQELELKPLAFSVARWELLIHVKICSLSIDILTISIDSGAVDEEFMSFELTAKDTKMNLI